jgi:hypothetical protein
MSQIVKEQHPEYHIVWAVSPVCFATGDKEHVGRVFPSVIKAFSDVKVFFGGTKVFIPEDVPDYVEISSHGIAHVDHRLLDRGAQEISILVSCAMLQANRFTPPFHHWNEDTKQICAQSVIKLDRFEDGWSSLDCDEFTTDDARWYCHPWKFTIDTFSRRMGL